MVVVAVMVGFVRCCSLLLVVARSCSELLFLFVVVVDLTTIIDPNPKSENFQGIKSSSILH